MLAQTRPKFVNFEKKEALLNGVTNSGKLFNICKLAAIFDADG